MFKESHYFGKALHIFKFKSLKRCEFWNSLAKLADYEWELNIILVLKWNIIKIEMFHSTKESLTFLIFKYHLQLIDIFKSDFSWINWYFFYFLTLSNTIFHQICLKKTLLTFEYQSHHWSWHDKLSEISIYLLQQVLLFPG